MKKWITVLLVVCLALSVVGCASTAKKGEEAKEPAKTEETAKKAPELADGTLTLGSDTAFPPFESQEAGKVVGFDYDLAQAIGEKLGVKAEFIPTAFDGIIPGLTAKKYDAIMSAMTITKEREKQILFSEPYIDSNQSLAVAKDSGIKGAADLKDKVVGVQRGTTGELTAKENKAKWGLKDIKSYDDTLLAFEDLSAGRLSGVINDYPVSAYIVKSKPKLRVVEEIKTNESYGIGLRQESVELKAAIDGAIKELQSDGKYDEIYAKWFGAKK